MTATKLNSTQQHLLEMFSHNLGENTLADIKKILTDYFVAKADEEMALLQEQHPTTQADLDTLLNTHLRTPYKTQ